MSAKRKTAIDIIGDVPWGTHFCQFYETKQDLLEILVPYFKAGLENNEFCMWVTSEPLSTEEAKEAMRKEMNDLDEYMAKGQIEIFDYSQWYTKSGRFDAEKALAGWVQKEKQAVEKGFEGLRLTGNTWWLEKNQWRDFIDYETTVDSVIGNYRMLAICTYSLEKCTPSQIIDVVGSHEFALIRREGTWEIIESAEYKKVRAEKERLLRAIELTKEGILITGTDGKIVYTNNSIGELFGYDKGELIGKHVSRLNAGPQPEEVSRQITKAIKKRGFWEGEVNNKRKDGTEFVSHAVITAVKDEHGKISNFISTQRDITEHKRAEERLKAEKEFTETALNAQTDTFFVFEPSTGKAIRWNKAFNSISGYSDEEIQSMKAPDSYYSEDDLEKAAAATERILKDGVGLVELSLITKDGRSIPTEYTGSLIRDNEGKPKYIIAVGRDITKRKEAEEALRESERQLSTGNRIAEIFLTSPDDEMYAEVLHVLLEAVESRYGVFGYIDEDGALVCASMTRDIWEQCELPDKTIVFPREKWGGIWGRTLIEKRSLYANEDLRVPEGHVPITRVLVVPIIYGGELVGILEVANRATDYGEKDRQFLEDIAGHIAPILNARLQRDRQEKERKEVEKALLESEEKYRTLLKNIPQKIFYKDLTSAYVLCNDSFAEDLKIKPEEIKGKTDYDFFPKELADKYRTDDKRILESGNAEEIEEQYVKDGKNTAVHTFKAPLRDEEGNTIGIFGIFWDITDRKQAEEALRRSEERYALAQKAASIGSWDWDILTGKLTWSEQIEPMFGFGRGEFGGTYEAFLGCVHPEDHQHVVDSVNACIEEGEDYAIEHRIVWPDGTVRWVSEKGDVIRDDNGNAIRMVGVVQDVTERKTAEQRLLVGSSILQIINQKERGQGIIRRILQLVKEFTDFDAIGIRLRAGEDFPYYEVSGFSGDFVSRENYLCARDESGELVHDSQGRPVLECMCGNVILGRAEPTAPFFTKGGSFWTNSTTDLLASTSDEDRLTHTRNHCNRAGYESVALIPLRSGEEIIGLLQLNDHRRGCFTADMIQFFEGIGDRIGIALARIRAEEEIESLARFPSESPCSILRIASDGTILYANTPGCQLLAEWQCDVGGQIPQHWHQYICRTLKSGSGQEVEIPCADRIFSLIVAPVVDAGYVNVYGIDVTERKQAEEDLRKYRQHLEELVQARTAELTEANEQLLQEIEQRKRLEKEILNVSEREQRRIGRELHDSIGQQLTGVAFMTKVLEKKLTNKCADEAADVAEIGKLVNQATDQARALAKGLHPVDLDAGSLMSALRELAANTEKLFGVRCTFRCEQPVPVDEATVAVNLYRITQEAVTNALKHGRAKNITVELVPAGDKCVLRVSNDGLDFPEDKRREGSGMGLQIMNHRAEMIDGSLDIRSGDKKGTVVTCTFPNKRSKKIWRERL